VILEMDYEAQRISGLCEPLADKGASHDGEEYT